GGARSPARGTGGRGRLDDPAHGPDGRQPGAGQPDLPRERPRAAISPDAVPERPFVIQRNGGDATGGGLRGGAAGRSRSGTITDSARSGDGGPGGIRIRGAAGTAKQDSRTRAL